MIDLIRLLHPLIAVLVIYPLVGVSIFLGIQTHERRSGNRSIQPTTGSLHSDLGQWVTIGLVLMVLVGLAASAISHSQELLKPVGYTRSLQLLIGFGGTTICLLSLALASNTITRLVLAFLTWLGVTSLAAQPELGRAFANPLHPSFWHSHTWPGVILTGIMLFALAARRDISRQLSWRRVHLVTAVFAGILFVIQALTGVQHLARSTPHLHTSWSTHSTRSSLSDQIPSRFKLPFAQT